MASRTENERHGPADAAAASAAVAAPALAARTGEVDAEPRRGLSVRRRFTRAGADPFELVEWERRDAVIQDENGRAVFEQRGVEFPRSWSQLATNVVASKYFRGPLGTPERETSLRQLIGRVVDTVATWGEDDGYFATPEDTAAFRDELTHLLLHQKLSFNSPVWFNCGVEARPQVSACFINSVDDTMDSILSLAKTEGMLFKYGSGAGVNLSAVRSSREQLRGGGQASGPVSFMRGFDAFAGVIKSGGKTRRAAKMVILNDDHPDILDFVESKEKEERKAWALIDAGYDGRFNGEAYGSVFFQNANHSVRASDDFMRAVVEDRAWTTRRVTNGAVVDTYRARDLMHAIARGTHVCGDPGMQFDTTINAWHTCPNSGRINASNPCSEYMFLDDSACNLASLNLLRFVRGADGGAAGGPDGGPDDGPDDGVAGGAAGMGPAGDFDTDAFCHAVDLAITAQEIFVDRASYPTERIGANSHRFRPLGLGYANLGALLMARGLAYDSEQGRDYAAAVTALMTGEAYLASARIARERGPFAGFPENREPFLKVMRKHRLALGNVHSVNVPLELMAAARQAWDRAVSEGERHGYRNAQVTVLAPTGTIAFMMDCDTTGIEPDVALVKYKRLVGGGQLEIVNHTVPGALRRLGYDDAQVAAILAHIEETDTIEGAPELELRHLPVFDCAFKPVRGQRFIHHMGHLRMMAAVQPFLSGAISKTVNLPAAATVDDIEAAYLDAWRMGVKAVAIYRDNSKRTQPLALDKTDGGNAGEKQAGPAGAEKAAKPRPEPYRRRLPDERQAITHKFSVGGHEGYLTVGMYEDGTPGEIFIVMAKQGSVVSGLMDNFATAISMALQYGVPLDVLVNKFSHTRFEPSGFTRNPDIPIAKSITDYIFRWLSLRFMKDEPVEEPGGDTGEAKSAPAPSSNGNGAGSGRAAAHAYGNGNGNGNGRTAKGADQAGRIFFLNQQDSPACPDCGSITVRNGACYKCMNCGATTGCS
jgi:ribonucleoside-diphosphate reductase alpha chain